MASTIRDVLITVRKDIERHTPEQAAPLVRRLAAGGSALVRERHHAALHVDPTDEDAIAEAITILARSPERRAELSRRARARAALYPASKMAAGLLDVYRTAWSRRRACA